MDELETTIAEFEDKLKQALIDKYTQANGDLTPQQQTIFIEHSNIVRFDIMTFYRTYIASGQPQDRLGKLVHALFDMGLYNTILYSRGYDATNTTPYELIKKMSLDQNVIVKSRILWERMMNFASVYISGEEVKVSSGKSKKGKFFKIIEGTPWIFLKDYSKTLSWYDDTLRTPEVHSGSVLRKNFQHIDDTFEDNSILVLYNIAINLFYPNIIAIAQGNDPPYKVWSIGMQEEGNSGNHE